MTDHRYPPPLTACMRDLALKGHCRSVRTLCTRRPSTDLADSDPEWPVRHPITRQANDKDRQGLEGMGGEYEAGLA